MELARTVEVRENCVLETFEGVFVTVYSPGSVPSGDVEDENPAGSLGSIEVLSDGTFEVDLSAGHAPPLGRFPTFDAALEAVLRD